MNRQRSPLISQINAGGVRTALLDRALSLAPPVLAVDGILGPTRGRDCELFYHAMHQLMRVNDRDDESGQAFETLAKLDTLVGPDLRRQLLDGDRGAFSDLALLYASPREDAAYALGLAVGLLFAGGVR